MSTIDTDRLDADRINAAAAFAAEQLRSVGVARVHLAPGDMTDYPFLIATPGPEWNYDGTGYSAVTGSYYWVALCCSFGAGYPWTGGPVDAYYGREKWTNPGSSKATRAWTGEVVTRFLTAVSAALEARP